jgi:ribonuclease Z
MAELLLLGTGAGLTDGSREPTMLALRGSSGSTVLIDCGSNPARQLQQLGVPLDSIERLIVTHSHPDHTSGFALLVEMLWLAGRRHPLPVHGPEDAVQVLQRVMTLWDLSNWKAMFEVAWHVVPLELHAPMAHTPDFVLTAAPGVHSVPVIGVRARDLKTGGTAAYGADGEASGGIRELAQGVDLLVHEANGPFKGHCLAQAAAQLARDAGARRLVLVHLSPQRPEFEAEYRAAQAVFEGELSLGTDLARYEF